MAERQFVVVRLDKSNKTVFVTIINGEYKAHY